MNPQDFIANFESSSIKIFILMDSLLMWHAYCIILKKRDEHTLTDPLSQNFYPNKFFFSAKLKMILLYTSLGTQRGQGY